MHELHGQTKDGQPRIYRIWRAMRFRCQNPGHAAYPRYGGRGITVCKEWDTSYLTFWRWAIRNGYEDNLSIDRIDNDGNYEPRNCRWATAKEQAGNMSSQCMVEVNGVSKSVCAWGKHTGIHLTTLYRRYRKGVRGEAFLVRPIPKPKSITLEDIATKRK